MTGTRSRTATATAVKRGGVEAESKAPARGTRSAYEATQPVGEGSRRSEAQCHPDRRSYMQRVDGAKVTCLTSGDLEACRIAGQRSRKAAPEVPGVSRGHKS